MRYFVNENKWGETMVTEDYKRGYDDGFKACQQVTNEEKLIARLKSGEIPIPDDKVWVLIPNENIFKVSQYRFFKTASPKQLYAKLAQISQTYAEKVIDQLEQERARDESEQVDWDRIMEIIRSIPGIGDVRSSKIDSEVRKHFE